MALMRHARTFPDKCSTHIDRRRLAATLTGEEETTMTTIVLAGALAMVGVALVWWEIMDFLFDRIDLRRFDGDSAPE
jgi:hypothetical protein